MKPIKLMLAALLAVLGLSGVEAWAKESAPKLAMGALLITACSLGYVDPAVAMSVGFVLMAGNAPFPIQPELTAIAIAYRNQEMIADDVLPRFGVGKKEFKYLKHDLGEGFTLPDTKVGRRSSPGIVEFQATESSDFTEDFGLDDVIPNDDIDNAPPNYDPQGKAVASLTNLILLDREKRVADKVFAAATYPAANKTTLSGTSQWSDYTNSDPVFAIMTNLDVPVMRPNIAVFGRATWTKLRMHPKVVQAVLGVANTGTGLSAGVVSRQAVADLLELEAVYVGASFVNTAKKGQTVSLSRLWGKHAAFLYRDVTALHTNNGVTFGGTAQFGSRIAASWDVKEGAGLKGGKKIRTGESVRELILASDVSFFFENAVA